MLVHGWHSEKPRQRQAALSGHGGVGGAFAPSRLSGAGTQQCLTEVLVSNRVNI